MTGWWENEKCVVLTQIERVKQRSRPFHLDILLFATFFIAGCASAGVTQSAPSAPVERGEAWAEAERLAAMGDGRFVVWGIGRSMAPVYEANAILVVSRIDFGDLAAGMHVAYSDARGRIVVHELIERDASGWVAKGIGNPQADPVRVTEGNLRGAVYAVFYPEE